MKKQAIISGVIQGVVFAIVMALFDMWKDEPFSVMKFMIHFIAFGLIMVVSNHYKQKKADKKQ